MSLLVNLVGKASSGDHGGRVAGASVSRGRREVGLAVASSGQDGVLGVEPVYAAILKTESNDANTLSGLHEQVQSEVLDKVVAVVPKERNR